MTPASQSPARGIILFAHGSRDPLWKLPIESVARRIQERQPGAQVACAYLELTTPDLSSVTAQMVSEGAIQIRIVPMFLGVGRHAREDLPELLSQLKSTHPDVEFELQPAVGEDPRLIDQIAQIAIDT
jgi:sirohydrochlorin cobaltochelatase